MLDVMIIAAVSIAAAGETELDLSSLAARARPSVLHLAIRGPAGDTIGNGSGFFISRSGLIATNEHVIRNAHEVRAVMSNGTELEIPGVLARSSAYDLAILAAPEGIYPTLALGRSSGLKQGDPVVVIGSPRGLSGTLSEGIVSALRDHGLGEIQGGGASSRGPLIQITAPISPGSSGSPVLDRKGKVIGVAVSVFRGAQNLNFAVPVLQLKDLLASIEPDTEPEGFRPAPLTNLLFSTIALAAAAVAIYLTGQKRKKKKKRARS